ncbi:hypothetical protein TD95_003345 [Thielaviopsis punctulata]|uniref:TATA-binding protein interacting (TIP20) domain-containing protein n=1 Tax=Thielaviopsis punctulata TaxID=72032 RepID=A0A0F4Z8P1_9PEZI|nr:hypothetical protein TD95_003345 [Thielaviopsis punctulata]
MANLPPTTASVSQLLGRLNDNDADFRFMALNDLMQVLTNAKPDILAHDYNTSSKTVDCLVKALDDSNGEVQNLAVKCLGLIAPRVPISLVGPLLDKLASLKLEHSVDISLPSMALRNVIKALPSPTPMGSTAGDAHATSPIMVAISRYVVARLISPVFRPPSGVDPSVRNEDLLDKIDTVPEQLDVLIEVVRSMGQCLAKIEIELLLKTLLQCLANPKSTSAARKRAVIAISLLAVYISEGVLSELVNEIVEPLKDTKSSSHVKRLYISIAGSMARASPQRIGAYASTLMPPIFDVLSQEELDRHMQLLEDGENGIADFEDIRESALSTLESFLGSCPQEMKPYTEESVAVGTRFISFDPNYAADDEDMEVDEEEEDDDEDDDDFGGDDDDFGDDDDDTSWKVRRGAVKTLYTLISTRGSSDLLETGVMYDRIAPELIKRFNDRDESVRLDVISALSTLIRKTGEGIYPGGHFDEVETETTSLPLTRKRRRQSSNLGSNVTPVVEVTPVNNVRAELARLSPKIVKVSLKVLKGKLIPTNQAVLSLLDDLIKVQRGGVDESFEQIVTATLNCLNTSASSMTASIAAATGSASATQTTLKVSALTLIRDICKIQPTLLKLQLGTIIKTLISTIGDKFYKISSEAILTTEEIVKYFVSADHIGECGDLGLNELFDVIYTRVDPDNKVDTEVRQRAIHAFGAIAARSISPATESLLSADRRASALKAILFRFNSETTKMASIQAVDSIATFNSSLGALDSAWIEEVMLVLVENIDRAKRQSRSSSMQALKHLAKASAASNKLQDKTVQRVVASLIPRVTSDDVLMASSALWILSYLVLQNAALVASDQLSSAIVQILSTRTSNMSLEPLVALVTSVGQSGLGAKLMGELLENAPQAAATAVYGQIIGTLLVAGGQSTNVTVEAFAGEIQNNQDAKRVSLALAVLGEAGKRMGGAFPLEPSVFLEQFKAAGEVPVAAAVALGRAGSGNVDKYLTLILDNIDGAGTAQSLLIQALREILQSDSPALAQHLPSIWNHLIGIAESLAEHRVVVAECLGRMVVFDPVSFMPKLQELLGQKTPMIRGMAIQALRYTLPESNEAFDAALRSVLVSLLLTVLKETDMDNRRLGMTTLTSALQNKPEIILPRLNNLLPFIIEESKIKPHLVREIMMGPFKHTVDDGLEVRKSAYETLYALLDMATSRIDIPSFYDRVVAGLKDDQDIRSLCNLMVIKLSSIAPEETARRLDSIAEAYKHVLSHKLKEGAVKQDVEKQEEASKGVMRVSVLLAEKVQAPKGGAGGQVWAGYWEWFSREYAAHIKAMKAAQVEAQS